MQLDILDEVKSTDNQAMKTSVNISMEDNQLTQVLNQKYLGIVIYQNFTYYTHMESLIAPLNRCMYCDTRFSIYATGIQNNNVKYFSTTTFRLQLDVTGYHAKSVAENPNWSNASSVVLTLRAIRADVSVCNVFPLK